MKVKLTRSLPSTNFALFAGARTAKAIEQYALGLLSDKLVTKVQHHSLAAFLMRARVSAG